jgi:hypothetical protein
MAVCASAAETVPACGLELGGSCDFTPPSVEGLCGAGSSGCPRYDQVNNDYNQVKKCVCVCARVVGREADANQGKQCVSTHGGLLLRPLCFLPLMWRHPWAPFGLQLYTDWEKAESRAKEEISSMVFNTFIWCQVNLQLRRPI